LLTALEPSLSFPETAATIPVGNDPQGVAHDAATGNIFVTHAESSDVNVLSDHPGSSSAVGGILGLPGSTGYHVIAGLSAVVLVGAAVTFHKRPGRDTPSLAELEPGANHRRLNFLGERELICGPGPELGAHRLSRSAFGPSITRHLLASSVVAAIRSRRFPGLGPPDRVPLR
jgi:hypothetical protein